MDCQAQKLPTGNTENRSMLFLAGNRNALLHAYKNPVPQFSASSILTLHKLIEIWDSDFVKNQETSKQINALPPKNNWDLFHKCIAYLPFAVYVRIRQTHGYLSACLEWGSRNPSRPDVQMNSELPTALLESSWQDYQGRLSFLRLIGVVAPLPWCPEHHSLSWFSWQEWEREAPEICLKICLKMLRNT